MESQTDSTFESSCSKLLGLPDSEKFFFFSLSLQLLIGRPRAAGASLPSTSFFTPARERAARVVAERTSSRLTFGSIPFVDISERAHTALAPSFLPRLAHGWMESLPLALKLPSTSTD
ncbi:hypothetical protein QR685DRAFT_599761 [Neurospora intermedia]|uniref:Uncharacterized protein n=1 Tax=Neurospora intermedia TaxID=5142 RepID=A0ABR3D4Q6_NEUIN